MEKITKLHALRKFKIDEDTIREFYGNYKGRVHEFFTHLAKYLPKYLIITRNRSNISKINVMWHFVSK
jgi:nucleoside diphosphate kinase